MGFWEKNWLASKRWHRNRDIITPERQGKYYCMLDLFSEDPV